MAALADNAKIFIFIGVLIAGYGKSAQLPLHFWLPDAMVAPTPISAYLHAASMVKVGVYIFARCMVSAGNVPQVIGIIGAVLAIITMVYGFAMYFPQKDMKKLLAYSTITQLSYIFLAFRFPFSVRTGIQWRGDAHLQPCLRQEPVLPRGGRAQLHHRDTYAANLARNYAKDCR